MTTITPRMLCRVICQIQYGAGFDEKEFSSAFAKFGRHNRNKYGAIDWKEEVAENGSLKGVLYFYSEDTSRTGLTFNQETALDRR